MFGAWNPLLTIRKERILRGPMGMAERRAANIWSSISRGRVDSGILKTAWILILRVVIETRLLKFRSVHCLL